MTISVLAPRPGGVIAPITPRPQAVMTHSDVEWAALYPDLERLYVRERRKLRYVMQYMESEHGFRATEQMYKKRFAKWGFQKNSKRSGTMKQHPLKTKNECKIVAISPSLGRRDSSILVFLTSVRTWSASFFESVQYHDGTVASEQQPNHSHVKETNFAFKLAIDLLDRGHGDMAGRVARKAFLLVENMLELEGPALLWNLLEMMHHMLMLQHTQLFRILLTHLIALVDGRMPATHPLLAMLRSLRGLVANLTIPESTPNNPPSEPSSSPSYDITTLTDTLPFLLQQAWILNAEVLFTRFDPRLFHLYFGILWESCSIAPPLTTLDATQGWFSKIEAQQALPARTAAMRSKDLVESKASMAVPAPRVDASPPQNYEMLRTNSMAVLGRQWNATFSKGVGFNGDTTVMLRILAGLGTAKLLDGSPVMAERSNIAAAKIPRFDAGNVACMIRAVVDLAEQQNGGNAGVAVNAIERIRAVVALSGYAEDETYPQVVRDMWLLQDALVAAGEHEEAEEVERDAFRRIERYIYDIPVAST